jgi:hypothetical protein
MIASITLDPVSSYVHYCLLKMQCHDNWHVEPFCPVAALSLILLFLCWTVYVIFFMAKGLPMQASSPITLKEKEKKGKKSIPLETQLRNRRL